MKYIGRYRGTIARRVGVRKIYGIDVDKCPTLISSLCKLDTKSVLID